MGCERVASVRGEAIGADPDVRAVTAPFLDSSLGAAGISARYAAHCLSNIASSLRFFSSRSCHSDLNSSCFGLLLAFSLASSKAWRRCLSLSLASSRRCRSANWTAVVHVPICWLRITSSTSGLKRAGRLRLKRSIRSAACPSGYSKAARVPIWSAGAGVVLFWGWFLLRSKSAISVWICCLVPSSSVSSNGRPPNPLATIRRCSLLSASGASMASLRELYSNNGTQRSLVPGLARRPALTQ
mmetsp:Transcript_136762/g.237508  ORF Transcript_136762/g.237508 Transcript_136762/m.237508 type:complete len:242 (+) Transcript_136762:1007-1732(+)